MKKRRCKICDNELPVGNFCPVCRQFVSVYETEQNYYLNESHNANSAQEADCTYHHPQREQNASGPDYTPKSLDSKAFEASSEVFGAPSKQTVDKVRMVIIICIAVFIFLNMCCGCIFVILP